MNYTLLGQTGLRISKLVLGTGNFGTGWGYGSDRAEASGMFAAYRDAGGNFIDTADQYQFGQSESLLGEFLGGDRDDIVLATKYGLGDSATPGLQRTGNSRKALMQSVEASLRRLRTDRIDVLWAHMPDGVTLADEILRGVDDLVRAGKVLYLGLSNFPAWRVAGAAVLAQWKGWAPVSAVQLEYSLVERAAERELLPMASAFALGVVGWSPLGGGLLTGKYRQGQTGRAQGLAAVIHQESDDRKRETLDTLMSIAEATGHSPGQLALAWVRAHGVVPIIGPRTKAQLADNLASLEVELTPAQQQSLDQASAIVLGFPHDVVNASASALAGGVADPVDAPRHRVR